MAAVIMVAMGGLCWGLFGPEPRIAVSRDTTFITDPLAHDLLPDYQTSLLALYGPAIPADENAAVVLLQAFWPMDMSTPSAELSAVCRALGIPDTPPSRVPLAEPEQHIFVKAAADKSAIGSFEAALQTPWKGGDLPELEAWVAKHGPVLDRLLEASRRPRYWFPSPGLLVPNQILLLEKVWLRADVAPDIKAFGLACRSLACRAMWHAGAGRTRESWDDILAIHRLSRLFAPGPGGATFFMSDLEAIAAAGLANGATRQLLAMPGLGNEERAGIHRDLATLAPLCSLRNAIAAERLLYVEYVVGLARRKPGGRRQLAELVDSPSGAVSVLTSLDWNLVLKRLNAAYDEFEAAASLPTAAAQETELRRVESRHVRALSSSGWIAAAGQLCRLAADRSERSILAAEMIQTTLVSRAWGRCAAKAARAEADFAALLADASDAVGQDEVVERLLIALFTGGHLILEGVRRPAFTNLLLADEINRAAPKVQIALLEAMQERKVTIGKETHPLRPRPS